MEVIITNNDNNKESKCHHHFYEAFGTSAFSEYPEWEN